MPFPISLFFFFSSFFPPLFAVQYSPRSTRSRPKHRTATHPTQRSAEAPHGGDCQERTTILRKGVDTNSRWNDSDHDYAKSTAPNHAAPHPLRAAAIQRSTANPSNTGFLLLGPCQANTNTGPVPTTDHRDTPNTPFWATNSCRHSFFPTFFPVALPTQAP